VEEIERRIHTGELTLGERLDPVRVAADRLGLAPNTVASAYRDLAERSLVEGRGRAGTFVGRPYRPSGDLIPGVPAGVVDLASGRPDPELLPDLGPFLAGLNGSTTTYGDPAVAPELEKAVAPLLESEGVPVGSLVVAGGAGDAIERALGAWLHPGDAVAVEDPGWFAIADLIRAMGLVVVPVGIDESGLVPSDLAQALSRIRAVVVTPRAQNPTGAATSTPRVGELIDIIASRPDLLVVEDDHLGPVAGAPLESLSAGRERWVHIRSFAKALSPDLRIAVATGDPETIERVQLRQCVGPGWVSHVLQRTTAMMLASEEVGALTAAAGEAYRVRRQILLEALSEVGLPAQGASGLNVWVPVADEEVATRSVLERGYAVRAGRRFRHLAPTGVRVTISSIDGEIARIVAEALSGGRARSMTRRA